MSPTQRAIAPLFAAAYDIVGTGAIILGVALVAAARAIRRDLNAEHHPHAAPAEDRKAANLDELRDIFAKARRQQPEIFVHAPDFAAVQDAAYQRTIDRAVDNGMSRAAAERLVNAIRASRDPNAN